MKIFKTIYCPNSLLNRSVQYSFVGDEKSSYYYIYYYFERWIVDKSDWSFKNHRKQAEVGGALVLACSKLEVLVVSGHSVEHWIKEGDAKCGERL